MWEEIKNGDINGTDLKAMNRIQKTASLLLTSCLTALLVAIPYIL
jgi:hypothetical protein